MIALTDKDIFLLKIIEWAQRQGIPVQRLSRQELAEAIRAKI